MSQPSDLPQVQEKAPKPQGLLPKNVQSWLLVGLAFLMVAIMWLTGGKKPQTPTKGGSSGSPVQVPLEVNETKIADLQNRIEELQRQQLVAQSTLAQQTRLLGGAQDASPAQPAGPSATGEEPHEDPIQAERKRRAYVSLFASNVALTYRKTPASAPALEPEAAQAPAASESDQTAKVLKEMQGKADSLAPSAPSPSPAGNDSAEKTSERKEEMKNPAAVAAGAANAAAGKNYLLFEGTILESVL